VTVAWCLTPRFSGLAALPAELDRVRCPECRDRYRLGAATTFASCVTRWRDLGLGCGGWRRAGSRSQAATVITRRRTGTPKDRRVTGLFHRELASTRPLQDEQKLMVGRSERLVFWYTQEWATSMAGKIDACGAKASSPNRAAKRQGAAVTSSGAARSKAARCLSCACK